MACLLAAHSLRAAPGEPAYDRQMLPAPDSVLQPEGLPYRLTLLPSTRETILRDDAQRGDLALGFFNVLHREKLEQMWYFVCTDWDVFSEKRGFNPRSLSIRYAWSADGGATWNRTIPGRAGNDLFEPEVGVTEHCVFYDPVAGEYRMIYSRQMGPRKWATFLARSADGVSWENFKQVFESSYDTQYGVVQADGRYYLFMRDWILDHTIRVMGLAVITPEGETIAPPRPIATSTCGEFRHIYNNAVTRLEGGELLFFPTFYNPESQLSVLSFAWGALPDQVHLSYIDLTSFLLMDGVQHGQWICAAPGLVPVAGEKDRYWLYYELVNASHDNTEKSGVKTSYHRIKLIVEPLK